MSKQPTQTEAGKRPNLAPLTTATPFVATLHRTACRDNLKVFAGSNRHEDAEIYATHIAARNGTVFLLQPVKVFTPPKEPVVEVAELNFSE